MLCRLLRKGLGRAAAARARPRGRCRGAAVPRWAPPCRGRSRPAGSERAGMAGRGESLSMFVVQRTFTTVRRGYDPAEVDRHLELVSRWFTRTDAGEALSRERGELRDRER